MVEALAHLAEHGGGGHAHVLEGEQRGVGGVHAELLELLLADHSRGVHRHEEQGEPVVAGLRVGLGDEHDHIGAVAVRDVGLGAVDDVVIAVSDGAGLDAGDIGAGVRLGDAQAEDLLALDRRDDPLLLLLLGAEGEDRRHRHVGVDGDPHRKAARVGVADLLGEHQRRVVVASLPAVGLRLVQAEEAELAHAREDGVGEGRLLPLLRVGGSSLMAKLRIDSRSCSCSSVKMKCLRWALKSGFTTLSAVAMSGGLLALSGLGGCLGGVLGRYISVPESK